MSERHIVPPKTYLKVLCALMILMALTVGVAKSDALDFGHTWNLFIALTIAVAKMTFIILFFMHVKYSSGLTRVFAAAGFMWFIILITLTLSDYLSRGWISPNVPPPY